MIEDLLWSAKPDSSLMPRPFPTSTHAVRQHEFAMHSMAARKLVSILGFLAQASTHSGTSPYAQDAAAAGAAEFSKSAQKFFTGFGQH
jgi:hypothetical protein